MKRKLYVLMGPPGSGKSSWVEREGLADYTVSLDRIRTLLGSSDQRIDGGFEVQTRKEKTLWKLFYDIIEDRVANGERTFIDAPNIRKKYWNKYGEIARKHNAEIVCVDFRGQSLAELKQRNENRMDNKFVSPKDLMKSVDKAESLELDERIQLVKPDQFIHFTKSKSFNHYDEIYHFGDIHGSIEPLKEFFEDGLKDNALYIFLGDYIDRGSNNAEVIQLLESIADRENVILLEGNHERHLRKWAQNSVSNSLKFEKATRKELESKGIKRKSTLRLLNKLQVAVFYEYEMKNEKIKVLVNHGGIVRVPDVLEDISSEQMIRGVGTYKFDVDKAFSEQNPSNVYQIHGHRNLFKHPVQPYSNSFNLEGGVESGGHLRIIKLTKDGFHPIEIKNNTRKGNFEQK